MGLNRKRGMMCEWMRFRPSREQRAHAPRTAFRATSMAHAPSSAAGFRPGTAKRAGGSRKTIRSAGDLSKGGGSKSAPSVGIPCWPSRGSADSAGARAQTRHQGVSPAQSTRGTTVVGGRPDLCRRRALRRPRAGEVPARLVVAARSDEEARALAWRQAATGAQPRNQSPSYADRSACATSRGFARCAHAHPHRLPCQSPEPQPHRPRLGNPCSCSGVADSGTSTPR